MAKRHTCNKCEYYETTYLKVLGQCTLMGDINDHPYDYNALAHSGVKSDKAYGWDYESYRAGVYVGPEFGCIHWLKKQNTKE